MKTKLSREVLESPLQAPTHPTAWAAASLGPSSVACMTRPPGPPCLSWAGGFAEPTFADPTEGAGVSSLEKGPEGPRRGIRQPLCLLLVSSLGGHINPAVSFAMCLTGKMKWAKLPAYVLAQYLGAFLGSAVVFGINYDALVFYTGNIFVVKGPNATAHIFATYPQEYLSLANGFADQMVSTAFLILGVFAILDTDNLGVPRGLEPIAIGLLIILLTSSMALNSGCAMNPARDLGPRLFTYLAGWGPEVFTTGNNWWWVPIAGPMVGAALGAATYLLFIEIHHFPLSPCQKTDTEALHEHELAPLEEGK